MIRPSLFYACVSTALLPLTLLGACSGPLKPEPIETTGMANPELALQRSIASTTRDLRDLGTMRPPPAAIEQNIQPDPLTKKVWFAWRGPLNGAVRKLGSDIGYDVTIHGKSHHLGVELNQVGRVVDLLHVIGDQAGDHATLSVDPLHHSITVTYHA